MAESRYDQILALGTAALAIVSAIAVIVTLQISHEQNTAAETQNRYARTLAFADIYFSSSRLARGKITGNYLRKPMKRSK